MRGQSWWSAASPGVGKTALLDYAARQVTEILVLRAAGVEGESDLGFARLYGLARPILHYLESLHATGETARKRDPSTLDS